MVFPKKVTEGFYWISSPSGKPSGSGTVFEPRESILTSAFHSRGDVGPTKEETGFKSDKRYFADYADVQAIGAKKDFCRMVFPDGGSEGDRFFACALAGTEGLTSTNFATKKVRDGFQISRDDYMRDGRNGKSIYCRIIKWNARYQPMCLVANDFAFAETDTLDTEPPDDIKVLVDFYSGCMMWLRLRDDMLDYMEKAIIQVAGGTSVIEFPPRPTVSKGLHFNGVNQFVRLGDSNDLSLGNLQSLRSVRAFSVWVRFDEFTNNAHIFDFGNGAGKDNIFLGILGKGDPDSSAGNSLRGGANCPETTVPGEGSGAQWCPEMRAQDLYLLSQSNVDNLVCPGAETYADPAKAQQIDTRPKPVDPNAKRSRATLLYEVWDGTLRKMQVKINQAIGLDEWTHIAVTAASMDAVRPNIKFYVNGNLVFTQESGYLPQKQYTEKNYLGKSNWTDQPGEFELRDELLKGSIFDFRMYNRYLDEKFVKNIIKWGGPLLGVNL